MKIKHIRYINEKNAQGRLKEIYTHIKLNFGKIVEPFVLHSINTNLTAGSWILLYEIILVDNKVSRSIKEATATCISEVNKCRYCVDAHSIMLFGTDDKLIDKIYEIKNEKIIPKTKDEKIIHWALNSIDLENEIIKNPPFTKQEAPEIIGTAILFNYINRMVTVFAGETPLPINFFQKKIQKIASKLIFNKAISKIKLKGESLQFLTAEYKKNVPKNISKHSEIQTVLFHFKYLIYNNIEGIISTELKLLLEKESKKLNFLQSENRKNNLTKFIESVNNEEKQIAEFCFLIMFEPYKIYEKHINYLKQNFKDVEIIYLASFCSFIIADNIGNELFRFVK